MGSLYLYTTELGTTPPPELCTSRLLYDRFRQNRLRYYMINRTKVHHWFCGKMVLHGKQEFCTLQKKGILYNTEIRNFVQRRKQEYCTSLIWWEKRQCAHVCSKGGSTLARTRTPPGSELILSLEAWCHRILLPMDTDNLVERIWRGVKRGYGTSDFLKQHKTHLHSSY